MTIRFIDFKQANSSVLQTHAAYNNNAHPTSIFDCNYQELHFSWQYFQNCTHFPNIINLTMESKYFCILQSTVHGNFTFAIFQFCFFIVYFCQKLQNKTENKILILVDKEHNFPKTNKIYQKASKELEQHCRNKFARWSIQFHAKLPWKTCAFVGIQWELLKRIASYSKLGKFKSKANCYTTAVSFVIPEGVISLWQNAIQVQANAEKCNANIFAKVWKSKSDKNQ